TSESLPVAASPGEQAMFRLVSGSLAGHAGRASMERAAPCCCAPSFLYLIQQPLQPPIMGLHGQILVAFPKVRVQFVERGVRLRLAPGRGKCSFVGCRKKVEPRVAE